MPILKVTNYLTPTGNAPAPTNKPYVAIQTTWEVDDEEEWEECGEDALDGYACMYDYASILDSDQDEVNLSGELRTPSDDDMMKELACAFDEFCNYQEEYNALLDAGEEDPDMGDYIENYDQYIAIGACEALYDMDPQEMDMDDVFALSNRDNWKSYQPRTIEVVG